MRKNILKTILFFCVILLPEIVLATSYDPLVDIPGLGSSVTISSYLIGIYNFLLSIVGIVAVMMLILGGMRYISAVGNPSVIADAKNMVESAIGGLLLALLSWVIVNTINPDILYLNGPSLGSPSAINYSSCYVNYDSGTQECECKDGTVYTAIPSSADCDSACSYNCYNAAESMSGVCLLYGSDNETTPGFSGPCVCSNGTEITWDGSSACNDLCKDSGNCAGGKFLVVKIHARNSLASSGDYETSASSADPDELWDLYLTNDGGVDYFNITEDNLDGDASYNCAVLVINEDANVGLDEYWTYWVKEGTVLYRSKKNLYESLFNTAIPAQGCCDSSGLRPDCLVEAFGECIESQSEKVLKALFTSDILDDKVKIADLAVSSAAGYEYSLSRDLTCIDGYWQ